MHLKIKELLVELKKRRRLFYDEREHTKKHEKSESKSMKMREKKKENMLSRSKKSRTLL
jgi:hypothetical protein